MAAGRQAVRLDDAEIAAFLASHMKVQVGTVARDGGPHLTTLYYVLVVEDVVERGQVRTAVPSDGADLHLHMRGEKCGDLRVVQPHRLAPSRHRRSSKSRTCSSVTVSNRRR